MNIFNKALSAVLIIFWSVNGVAVAQELENVGYLEVMLLSINEDIQNYVLTIELINSPNSEAKEYLVGMLGSKLDDLVVFLPETKNIDTATTVCSRIAKLTDQIRFIASDCKVGLELCEKSLLVERVCTAKLK